MHDCPVCDRVCYCDLDDSCNALDSWNDCRHECKDEDLEDDDDAGDRCDNSPDCPCDNCWHDRMRDDRVITADNGHSHE